MSYCMILTTCPNKGEAEALGTKLVEKRLAACVQLSDVTSFYTWKDKACCDPEIRLVIKTQQSLYRSVEQFIKRHHSYDVPQIIQVPIIEGEKEYLDWIRQNTG